MTKAKRRPRLRLEVLDRATHEALERLRDIAVIFVVLLNLTADFAGIDRPEKSADETGALRIKEMDEAAGNKEKEILGK